jgi:DNA mismatch repair ATPase MutS
VVPWDFYLSYKLESEKQSLAENLHLWLDTWHNLQALSSLAEFAFLNPEYTFPTFNNAGCPVEAEGFAHPLIPPNLNVRNDFKFSEIGRVDIITGSNMSGKSTFLKSLGTNLVLAYAGAPVNAVNFNTRLFRVFTCIKIDDSVTDGISYFYAEVKRLRKLIDALNLQSSLPLFFLIDEIFRGTNNRERLTGSRAYIKALGGKNGLGLISTHDLELVKLESEMNFIRNFHFREEAIEGKLTFDYKLRTGPSPTTNALKIMKLEGLPIED